jgi:DNA-binding transcriptional MerR regulator
LNDTDLITVLEAAERLRTPAATLRYWRHVGIGPKSFKIGRRVVYRRDDLEAWVETQRKQSA